jgi:alcohol dehydrogenase/propanol-preferring alcohol dehydrogenase
VRVKVQACGICHSDSLTKEGQWPGLQYPRVPGHEIAGIVDAVGAEVDEWKVGQRVGVGWHGGHCGHCDHCRRGDFVLCQRALVPGISYDGGYANYMVAPVQALARIPDDLSDVDAAPLLCAGITTFNALRNSGARAGEVVAILGIGGLGHLGVQFARKMGFRTVAIARGKDKAPLAKELGAHHYIDSSAENVAESLTALGGAKVILATATSGKAMSAALGGLGLNGKMIMVGLGQEPVEVPIAQFIMGRHSVQGWPSGTSADSQDTLEFSALSGVKPVIEEFPLARAAEAYDRMMSGAARFRVVLTMS